MNNHSPKTREHTPSDMQALLQAILEEVRLLRQEILANSSEDRLEDYAHADRIKNSYHQATKDYPPSDSE